MSILYPKDWVKTKNLIVNQVEGTEIQNKIRAVVDKPKYYFDIVKEVKKVLALEGKYLTNREILKHIKIVDEEWHPIAVEPIEKPLIVKEK